MAFCSNCGKEVKDNTRFCPGCRASLTGESQSSNAQQNTTGGTICPKCGSLIPFGNVACTKCGSLVNPDKHTAAIVLGYICSIFLPLIGIIFGIYLLTRNSGKAKTQGVFLIGLIVLWIILNLLLRSWIKYLIIFILLGLGAYLWFEDYSIFD